MMNIYQRISAVMKDIEYLTKDDEVSTGRSSYRAVTEEKVTSAVRAALIKHGIVIVPIEQEHSRVDEAVGDRFNRVTTVNTRYRIQNIDDKDDFIVAASSGTGVDTQDKGVGKAMTYSFKYLLLRTFAIPTGEDPDKISSDLYTEQLHQTKSGAKQQKYTPNVYGEESGGLDATAAKLEIMERVPDPAVRNTSAQKRFKKNFDDLLPQEIIAAYKMMKFEK